MELFLLVHKKGESISTTMNRFSLLRTGLLLLCLLSLLPTYGVWTQPPVDLPPPQNVCITADGLAGWSAPPGANAYDVGVGLVNGVVPS